MDKQLSYLYTPSTSKVDPPCNTQKQELPIGDLAWEDFERLCLRIAQLEHSINDCEIYGVKGQKQYGIDIYASKNNGKYTSYQCKRYDRITIRDLDKAVSLFEEEKKWSSKSDQFVFCTSLELNKTQLQDKYNKLKIRLNQKGIELIKWDKVKLCEILKDQPLIVYDFFGESWVKEFNRPNALSEITKNRKLDANEVKTYREELLAVYSTVFQQYDPGIPTQCLDNLTYKIQERFILQDVFEERINNGIKKSETDASPEIESTESFDKEAIYNGYQELKKKQKKVLKQNDIHQSKNRICIDTKLPLNKKSIILGDPGSGKSTLLRYLILDLLSNNPNLQNISQAWSSYLPLWLPFAFISKHIQNDDSLSLLDMIIRWLKSIHKEHLSELVKQAFEDNRLLLLVDGIDEWTSIESARIAISKIEIQINLLDARVLYTSRPFGYQLLKDSFLNVEEIEIAPFSVKQQNSFVLNWYKKWIHRIGKTDCDYAQKKTTQFMQEISDSNEFGLLAGNPLMLSILIMLKFQGKILPRNKYDALQTITEHLMFNHPKKRNDSAGVITSENWDFNLSDIFKELAFYIQSSSSEGIVNKSDAKKVIVDFLVNEMNYPSLKGKKIADELLEIGANNIGILIEKASDDIAFIHRQFQEFLVAQYILESDYFQEIIIKYCSDPLWHQVFLCFFSIIPTRKKKYIDECISQIIPQNDSSIESKIYLTFLKHEILLNTNVIPPNLAHDAFIRIVDAFEYETNPRWKKILWKIILKALYNVKIKDIVRDYLLNFFPNKSNYSDYRIKYLKHVTIESLTDKQKQFLLKALINGNRHQRLDASFVIQRFMKDPWLHEQIVNILNKSSNPQILPYVLNCIASDNVTNAVKEKILNSFEMSTYPDIQLFVYLIKGNLNTLQNVSLSNVLSLYDACHYSLTDIITELVIRHWEDSEELFNICIKTIEFHDHSDKYFEKITSWNILLECFFDRKEIVPFIIKEINTNEYPFLHGANDVWDKIATKVKTNIELTNEIDLWLGKAKNNMIVDTASACCISGSSIAKDYLLKKLQTETFLYWIVWALHKKWTDDEDVIAAVKEKIELFDRDISPIAHWIPHYFQDDENASIQILEKIILDPKQLYISRAIRALIEINSDYFKKKWLKKIITDYLSTIPTSRSDDYFSIIHTLISNYKELQLIHDFVQNSITNDTEWTNILITFYPENIELIDKQLMSSIPLGTEYRIMLIRKMSVALKNDPVVCNSLAQYLVEGNPKVMEVAALAYFNELKNLSKDDQLIQCCEAIAYNTGITKRYLGQVAFEGYVIARRLSDYLKLKNIHDNKPLNPKISFREHAIEAGSSINKLLIDNFNYIFTEIGGNLKLITGSINEETFWGGLAIYSDKESQTYEYIIEFIKSNQDKICNLNLLDFLNRNIPNSSLLKQICMRLINLPSEIISSQLAGYILGTNFKKNDDVFNVVSTITDLSNSGGKIIALCKGWPNSSILNELADKLFEEKPRILASANFEIMSLFSENQTILQEIDDVIKNENNKRQYHSFFIRPYLNRIRSSIEIQDALYLRLDNSQNYDEKISFYSLLIQTTPNNTKLTAWKELQLKEFDKDHLGYNIVTNKWCSMSDILLNIGF